MTSPTSRPFVSLGAGSLARTGSSTGAALRSGSGSLRNSSMARSRIRHSFPALTPRSWPVFSHRKTVLGLTASRSAASFGVMRRSGGRWFPATSGLSGMLGDLPVQRVTQDVPHAVGIPPPPPLGGDAPAGQLVGDPGQRPSRPAPTPHLLDHFLLSRVGEQTITLAVKAVGRGAVG